MHPAPPSPPSLLGLRTLALSGNDLRAPPSAAAPAATNDGDGDGSSAPSSNGHGNGNGRLFGGSGSGSAGLFSSSRGPSSSKTEAAAGGASPPPPPAGGEKEAASSFSSSSMAGVAAVARILKGAADLRELRLVGCNLDGAALGAVLEGLVAGGCPLEVLDVSGNPEALVQCDPAVVRRFLEGTRRSLRALRAHGAKMEGTCVCVCMCFLGLFLFWVLFSVWIDLIHNTPPQTHSLDPRRPPGGARPPPPQATPRTKRGHPRGPAPHGGHPRDSGGRHPRAEVRGSIGAFALGGCDGHGFVVVVGGGGVRR